MVEPRRRRTTGRRPSGAASPKPVRQRVEAAAPAGDRLVVGLVRGLHGLNGAVRVEVLSDDESRFQEGSRVFAEGSTRPLTVSWVQPDAPGLLVRFREIPTREAADLLRDAYLEVERPADRLGEGEAYWHEVIGVPVTTTAGEQLGSVADVFRVGESEVYVVRGGVRGEVLVPAVRAVVTVFEPADGRIEVNGEVLGLDDEPPPRRARGRRSSRLPRGVTPERVEKPATPPGHARQGDSQQADTPRGDREPGVLADTPAAVSPDA